MVGVLVRFEAKPDTEDEVEALLRALVAQVQREVSTIAWFGFRLGPTTFGVFHAFADEASREAHLAAAGEAVRAKASELFTAAPAVDYVDIVSAKLPLMTSDGR
jgi:quinol monooxygenase YgiN